MHRYVSLLIVIHSHFYKHEHVNEKTNKLSSTVLSNTIKNITLVYTETKSLSKGTPNYLSKLLGSIRSVYYFFYGKQPYFYHTDGKCQLCALNLVHVFTNMFLQVPQSGFMPETTDSKNRVKQTSHLEGLFWTSF